MNFVKETEICIQFIKGNAFFFWELRKFLTHDDDDDAWLNPDFWRRRARCSL
jgi:hypothetical protein